MVTPITDIAIHEESILEAVQGDLVEPDRIGMSMDLCSILSIVLPHLESNSGVQEWQIEDMYANECSVNAKKLTLVGDVNWLNGGVNCTSYQVDIARNTVPLLYSYKFRHKNGKQLLQIRKTFTGWIVET